MLQSFWEYLRLAACDAILSGVEDAVRKLEQGRSPDDFVQASDRLTERLTRAAKRMSGQPENSTEPDAGESSGDRSRSQAAAPQTSPGNQPVPSLLSQTAERLNKREEASSAGPKPRGKHSAGGKS